MGADPVRGHDADRAARILTTQTEIAVLQGRLASLIGGCNTYFSPDGIESVKCNYLHRCPECEANPPAPIDDEDEG